MLFVRISPEDTVGVIGLIMLFVRVPPEDTMGVIGLIMLFVRVPPEDTMGGKGLMFVGKLLTNYRTSDEVRIQFGNFCLLNALVGQTEGIIKVSKLIYVHFDKCT